MEGIKWTDGAKERKHVREMKGLVTLVWGLVGVKEHDI